MHVFGKLLSTSTCAKLHQACSVDAVITIIRSSSPLDQRGGNHDYFDTKKQRSADGESDEWFARSSTVGEVGLLLIAIGRSRLETLECVGLVGRSWAAAAAPAAGAPADTQQCHQGIEYRTTNRGKLSESTEGAGET